MLFVSLVLWHWWKVMEQLVRRTSSLWEIVRKKLISVIFQRFCFWTCERGVLEARWAGPGSPGRWLFSDIWLIRHLELQPFNGLFSRTSQVCRYQKGKTNLDFTGARDSERQWHQLGHMQVWTSLQTDNHASTPPLCFLQAGCPSCRPTNSVKALKAQWDLIAL